METMRNGTNRPGPGAIGFDFGTTNTSLALLGPEGQLRLASFPIGRETSASFRSVLYFEQAASAAGSERTHAFTGPSAIEHYLQAEEKGL